METLTRILHVEDHRSDAELVKRAMRHEANVEWLWVSNKTDFVRALEQFHPDIILCDHSLPGFNSEEAFKIVREYGLKIPFILITGTISEEFAVMMMKEGISDYLLKDRIQRLPAAVSQALEKRQAEIEKEKFLEEIVRNEARFRALIENNYDAIILRDENLNIIYRSPSANKMIGYDEHEQLDPIIFNTVHPDDVPLLRERFEMVKKNPGKPFHLIVRTRHKDGHYLWVEGSMRNLLDNEDVKGIIFNYRDISERKESELQRDKMIADITLRIKGLEQFTYIVSHNLRAPVANILGISTLLKYDGLNEHEKKEALEGISSSATKLDEVIIDLNTILQMKKGVVENKQLVYFQVLIDDIYRSMSELIKSDPIKIITDFTKVEGIRTIKSYLYSIFFNLISNSSKYKRPGAPSVIEVTSFLEDDKTGLTFKDNGIGIDLAVHASEVFGLYKRFHLEPEGKGIGLFMVKTQIEALGGTISVRSEVNKGTEFTIIL
jgi:PAS domain S-box-containing protein